MFWSAFRTRSTPHRVYSLKEYHESPSSPRNLVVHLNLSLWSIILHAYADKLYPNGETAMWKDEMYITSYYSIQMPLVNISSGNLGTCQGRPHFLETGIKEKVDLTWHTQLLGCRTGIGKYPSPAVAVGRSWVPCSNTVPSCWLAAQAFRHRPCSVFSLEERTVYLGL